MIASQTEKAPQTHLNLLPDNEIGEVICLFILHVCVCVCTCEAYHPREGGWVGEPEQRSLVGWIECQKGAIQGLFRSLPCSGGGVHTSEATEVSSLNRDLWDALN